MKSLSESPAILTVHQGSPGQYILRGRRDLIIATTKMLTDARSFVVVTDKDVKVFAVGDNGSTPVMEETVETPQEIDPQTQAVIDEQESHSIPGSVTDDRGEVSDVEVSRVRKRDKVESVAGHDEACGRCSGTGKAKVIMDGGKGAETACPICQGKGVMKRYGARR